MPPSIEYSTSTEVTPTLSVAVHVTVWVEPAFQDSPPAGAVTVTTGAVTSPGVARRDAHSVAFRNSVLSVAPASPQPSKMLLFPGAAEPSSAGELSPAIK